MLWRFIGKIGYNILEELFQHANLREWTTKLFFFAAACPIFGQRTAWTISTGSFSWGSWDGTRYPNDSSIAIVLAMAH